MTKFTATVRAGGQLSTEAWDYRLVTEIYGLNMMYLWTKNRWLPIAKGSEKPFFLIEAKFFSGNIFARINDIFLDKSLA